MKWHIIALCILLCLMAGCAPNNVGSPTVPEKTEPTQSTQPAQESTTEPAAEPDEPEEEISEPAEEWMKNAIQATITMEDGGVIVLELYPELAPQSVRNFVYLARQGFYDGLKFHRIMKGFMIQGGDPDGNGSGGPGYSIKGEFVINGFQNDLKHERGVLSMARANAYNSGGSQFFIMHADASSLDGGYAAFGRVTSGMDVVDKIAGTPNSGPNGAVAEDNKPVMKSVTIDNDIELPPPDMIK